MKQRTSTLVPGSLQCKKTLTTTLDGFSPALRPTWLGLERKTQRIHVMRWYTLGLRVTTISCCWGLCMCQNCTRTLWERSHAEHTHAKAWLKVARLAPRQGCSAALPSSPTCQDHVFTHRDTLCISLYAYADADTDSCLNTRPTDYQCMHAYMYVYRCCIHAHAVSSDALASVCMNTCGHCLNPGTTGILGTFRMEGYRRRAPDFLVLLSARRHQAPRNNLQQHRPPV